MKINANLNVSNSTNFQKTNLVMQRRCTDRSNFPSTLSQDARIFVASSYSTSLKTFFDKILQFLKRCLCFFKTKEVTPAPSPVEPQNQQPVTVPTQGTVTPVLSSPRIENIPAISPQTPVQPNSQNATDILNPIPTLIPIPSSVILPTTSTAELTPSIASSIVTLPTTPIVLSTTASSETSAPTASSLTPAPSSVSLTDLSSVTPTITPTTPILTPTSAPITSTIPIASYTVTTVQSTNSITPAITPVTSTSATVDSLPGFDTLGRKLAERSFGTEKQPTRGFETLGRIWKANWQKHVIVSDDNNITTTAPQSVSPPIQSLESILLFYSGKGKNSDGLSLDDIRTKTDEILDEDNDLIAMLFPIDQLDTLYPKVPVLDQSMISAMKQNKNFRNELRTSLTTVLLFYGLFWSSRSSGHPRKIVSAPNFKKRAAIWLTPHNHNFHRITRILRSLTLFGYHDDSRSFLEGLLELTKNYPAINENIKSAWRKAATPS